MVVTINNSKNGGQKYSKSFIYKIPYELRISKDYLPIMDLFAIKLASTHISSLETWIRLRIRTSRAAFSPSKMRME